MKITSDKIYLSTLPENKVAISVVVGNRYLATRIVNEMEQHEQVQVSFKKYTSNRTLAQNDLMWAIIAKVSDFINGERTQESLNKIYAEILTQANVKRDLVAVLPNALPLLNSTFRAVVPTGQSIESVNEKTGKKATLITVWVYHGSSKLTTKEMSELLEYAFVYAIKSGVSAMEVDSLKGLYDYE